MNPNVLHLSFKMHWFSFLTVIFLTVLQEYGVNISFLDPSATPIFSRQKNVFIRYIAPTSGIWLPLVFVNFRFTASMGLIPPHISTVYSIKTKNVPACMFVETTCLISQHVISQSSWCRCSCFRTPRACPQPRLGRRFTMPPCLARMFDMMITFYFIELLDLRR